MNTPILNSQHSKKNTAKEDLYNSLCFKLIRNIATFMDHYYLDPLIGFFVPAVGDFISAIAIVPYLYISIILLKSFPLTLALIYNVLFDILIGLIPFLGDVCDVFNRSYQKNYKLIIGFVEKDNSVIKDVYRKAWLLAIGILLIGSLIYGLIHFLTMMIGELLG